MIPDPDAASAPLPAGSVAGGVIGVRYHLSDRFVLRADYALYTAFVADSRSTEYRAFTAGLSFFF